MKKHIRPLVVGWLITMSAAAPSCPVIVRGAVMHRWIRPKLASAPRWLCGS
jgi:hypothetical protein